MSKKSPDQLIYEATRNASQRPLLDRLEKLEIYWRKQADRIRELQAEKDEWKMMYEVIEEKLNEYIDKTKAAEVRLAEMHSAWSAGIQYDNWRANEEHDYD